MASSSMPSLDKKDHAEEDNDEESDYMSEAFLQSLEQTTTAGKNKQTNNHDEIERNQRMPRNKKIDVETVLQEGLAKPLSSENVGFKILAKMGFKPEEAKSNQIAEPLELVLKRDRAGLGVAEQERKQAKMMMDEEVSRMRDLQSREGELKDQFLKEKVSKFESRRLRGQLIKLRQIESNLYETLGVEPPPATVLGDPSEIILDDEDHKESDGEVVAPVEGEGEQLIEPDYAALVNDKVMKLRGAPFFYCFYCGARYADADDLAENCPGETEEDHD